jgi:hypothetical protein
MQFSPVFSYFLLFGPNIFLSTLFMNTFSLHSSLNVRDQVSGLYTTKGKIILQYISIYIRQQTGKQKIWDQGVAGILWI